MPVFVEPQPATARQAISIIVSAINAKIFFIKSSFNKKSVRCKKNAPPQGIAHIESAFPLAATQSIKLR